jgi:hypothetical protein
MADEKEAVPNIEWGGPDTRSGTFRVKNRQQLANGFAAFAPALIEELRHRNFPPDTTLELRMHIKWHADGVSVSRMFIEELSASATSTISPEAK